MDLQVATWVRLYYKYASLINHFGCVAVLFSHHRDINCSTNFPVCGVYDGN